MLEKSCSIGLTEACKTSSASSNRPGYYNIKQLERTMIGRSNRFGRSGILIVEKCLIVFRVVAINRFRRILRKRFNVFQGKMDMGMGSGVGKDLNF